MWYVCVCVCVCVCEFQPTFTQPCSQWMVSVSVFYEYPYHVYPLMEPIHCVLVWCVWIYSPHLPTNDTTTMWCVCVFVRACVYPYPLIS